MMDREAGGWKANYYDDYYPCDERQGYPLLRRLHISPPASQREKHGTLYEEIPLVQEGEGVKQGEP